MCHGHARHQIPSKNSIILTIRNSKESIQVPLQWATTHISLSVFVPYVDDSPQNMLKRFRLYQSKCSEIKHKRNTAYLSWGGWIMKYVYETTTDTPGKLYQNWTTKPQ